MENNEVSDMSEICRLCLDQDPSNILFSVDSNATYTEKSIAGIIKYCLNINVNSSASNEFLPHQICGACYHKLEETFVFKEKSRQSQDALKNIVHSMGFMTNVKKEKVDNDDDDLMEEIPLNPEDFHDDSPTTSTFSNGNSSVIPAKKKYGPYAPKKSGIFPCEYCTKTFKYIKSFKSHMKEHTSVMKNSSKLKSRVSEDEFQQPSLYDNLVFDNDDDVDSELDKNEDSDDKDYRPERKVDGVKSMGRGRPRIHPIRDSNDKKTFEKPKIRRYEDDPPKDPNEKKGRGRPRIYPEGHVYSYYVKKGSQRGRKTQIKRKSKEQSEAEHSNEMYEDKEYEDNSDDEYENKMSEFSEIDVDKVLKKEVSYSSNVNVMSPSTSTSKKRTRDRSRSRSLSIELIPEVDIFDSPVK